MNMPWKLKTAAYACCMAALVAPVAATAGFVFDPYTINPGRALWSTDRYWSEDPNHPTFDPGHASGSWTTLDGQTVNVAYSGALFQFDVGAAYLTVAMGSTPYYQSGWHWTNYDSAGQQSFSFSAPVINPTMTIAHLSPDNPWRFNQDFSILGSAGPMSRTDWGTLEGSGSAVIQFTGTFSEIQWTQDPKWSDQGAKVTLGYALSGQPAVDVPEPNTLALTSAAALALGATARRRRSALPMKAAAA